MTDVRTQLVKGLSTASLDVEAPFATQEIGNPELGLSTKSVIAPSTMRADSIDPATLFKPQTVHTESATIAKDPNVRAASVEVEEVPPFESSEVEQLVQEAANASGARPSSIRALIKEIAHLGRIFNQFSASYRDLYISSLESYASLTQNQISGMNAMAAAVIVSSVVGGTAGIAASFAPALIPAGGIGNIAFLNKDFVTAVLKNSGEILPRVGDGAKTILQGPVTKAESEKAMVEKTEITVQQQMIDQLTASLREVRQIVESVLQAKARQEG